MNEHQDENGLLKPPTALESTELPVEELNKPMEMRKLSLDEADTLRAHRSFVDPQEPLPTCFIEALRNQALSFSVFIIANCPEGKERSQALGQVQAAYLWAQEAGIKNK